ncbi:MAG TPA: TetR/AcrR family transcriptional regulator [Burkholderiales bacterium]|nr:TetR/AcrR family transcriptional regulator [Burkholderiales bacterium]
MARPREFDVNIALERAMQAFWAKGFKATTLDDLCAATRLSRSSLYAAFGGKRELLDQSLRRYEEQGIGRITAALSRPVPVREALAGFVDGLIERIVSGPGRSGCFIGNCAAELARQDRAVAARVRHSLERIEAAFREALVRARARGELAKTADVDAIARFLVAGIQGLRLVGKANGNRAALEDIKSVLLRCLEPSKEKP